MMGRGQLEHSIAFEAAKTEIANRLRHVCEQFSEADFTALVERMAQIDVKYRMREDWLFQSQTRPRLSYN